MVIAMVDSWADKLPVGHSEKCDAHRPFFRGRLYGQVLERTSIGCSSSVPTVGKSSEAGESHLGW